MLFKNTLKRFYFDVLKIFGLNSKSEPKQLMSQKNIDVILFTKKSSMNRKNYFFPADIDKTENYFQKVWS